MNNLDDLTFFTDVDHAIEEAQYMVNKVNQPYSIIRVRSKRYGERLYVIPTESVVESHILETFKPVSNE